MLGLWCQSTRCCVGGLLSEKNEFLCSVGDKVLTEVGSDERLMVL